MRRIPTGDHGNAFVFYDGPSQLTGAPIVGILSGLRARSMNAKTGDLLQAWILLRDESPTEAVTRGHDDAICGDCALRGEGRIGRGCYVTYWQGPLTLWKQLPTLPHVAPEVIAPTLRFRQLRLGAYGDPTAIPVATWQALLAGAAGAIGYTQQWKVCDVGYRDFLMASVLSTVDREDALARGWRTYRIRGPRDPILEGECICPASAEADHKLTCEACMLCNGGTGAGRANPVIQVHGKPGNYAAFGIRSPFHLGGAKQNPGRPRTIPLRPVS